MQLQRNIKGVDTGNFEFRNTRSGTTIVRKIMADFSAIRKQLENNNLSHFIFFQKSLKPIKAVIRHLPTNTTAQDISDGLVDQGYDIISVKQMSTNRQSPSEGALLKNLPLFLITLPRTAKSPIDSPLLHSNQGGGVRGSERPIAKPQLPTDRPRLGKLQATSPLFVVWG
jgi:hypothetical protein